MGFCFQRPGGHLLKILLLNGQQPSALSQVCKQKSLEASPANRLHMCTIFSDAADRCHRCASCGLGNLQGHNRSKMYYFPSCSVFRTMCIGVRLFLTWRGWLAYLQSPFELPHRGENLQSDDSYVVVWTVATGSVITPTKNLRKIY